MVEYIPSNELVLGAIYELSARHFILGVWDGVGFIGVTEIDGKHLLHKEYHYDVGSPDGTAHAMRRIGQFICPAPWTSQTLLACLDAAEQLWFELRDYIVAVDTAGYEMIDSPVRSETKTLRYKREPDA